MEKDLFAREWKMAAKIKHLNLHFVTPTQLCQIMKEIFNDTSKLSTFLVYLIYPHCFYNFIKNSQISQYIGRALSKYNHHPLKAYKFI